MTSENASSSSATKANEAAEPQDPIFTSIRTLEAIREFASDITPLQADGYNFNQWVSEVDKMLSDLIDRDDYLQSPPPIPFQKAEDKIARKLIFWSIPRELRSCTDGLNSAHEIYKALQIQFLRNNRTSHMAALVDLFNFQMQVSEPHHITTLYDKMYQGMNELIASGFQVNAETLLGALFQIALGRGNSRLYAKTSQALDPIVSTEKRQLSSKEVAAAARRQLENWLTVFEQGGADEPQQESESTEPLPTEDHEGEQNPIHSAPPGPPTNPTSASQVNGSNHMPSANDHSQAGQQKNRPTGLALKPSNVPGKQKADPVESPHTRPSKESSTSSTPSAQASSLASDSQPGQSTSAAAQAPQSQSSDETSSSKNPAPPAPEKVSTTTSVGSGTGPSLVSASSAASQSGVNDQGSLFSNHWAAPASTELKPSILGPATDVKPSALGSSTFLATASSTSIFGSGSRGPSSSSSTLLGGPASQSLFSSSTTTTPTTSPAKANPSAYSFSTSTTSSAKGSKK